MVAASAGALVVGIGFHGSSSPAATSKASPGAAPSATTAPAAGQPSSGLPVPVGITDPNLVFEPPAELNSDIRSMKAIGVESIRIAAQWNLIQADGPAKYNWTQLDQAVRAFRAAGMSVDMLINGCPGWAAAAGVSDASGTAQPASATQFATFAAAVAEHYEPDGVSRFEIWNEPNLDLFWSPKPDPAAYVADLEAAYSAIKQVDPQAFVLAGGLSPAGYPGEISPIQFLMTMYEDGAKGYFDGVAFHPYTYPATPNTLGKNTGWAQMDRTSPSLRSVMSSYGDSKMKIWVTEYGAPTQGPSAVGDTGEADELSQAIADAEKTSWIGALYIYKWRDSTDYFGLLTQNGVIKPAYYAVQSATGKFLH
jgi:polysaccharide biosynthesis protein PslG